MHSHTSNFSVCKTCFLYYFLQNNTVISFVWETKGIILLILLCGEFIQWFILTKSQKIDLMQWYSSTLALLLNIYPYVKCNKFFLAEEEIGTTFMDNVYLGLILGKSIIHFLNLHCLLKETGENVWSNLWISLFMEKLENV